MGTPDFAVPPLKSLVEAGHDVCLVVTQPDRPKGRGRKVVEPPVKTAAKELGINVIQPPAMKGNEIRETFQALHPDFFVIVAFGHIITQELLDIPAIYPINIHASLLPAYRGAAPIQAAILNMEKKSGVTTMVMDRHLDTGDILMKKATELSREETAETLHDRLSTMGAGLIVETIKAIDENKLIPVPQNNDLATYAPRLKKEDGRIDWNEEPREINARVRAMTPWPGAFTFLNGKRIKIFRVSELSIETDNKPGTVLNCDKQGIHVAAGTGALTILELQGASGKRLEAREFLKGRTIEPGTEFDT